MAGDTVTFDFPLSAAASPFQVPDIHVLRGQDPVLWVQSEAAVAATVEVEVSEDQSTWTSHGTITVPAGARDKLNITRTTGDDSPYLRFRLAANSGEPIRCKFEVFSYNPQLQAGLSYSP